LRRIASSFVVAVLFLSMFVFAFNVQTARAQSGIININPNGSISSPVPANITTSDRVTYTFTGNIYLPIVVFRSNIIINGMDHTLQASGGTGFSLGYVSGSYASHVTIKNTTITESTLGIFLDSSSGNVLSGNNIRANGWGIYLNYSSGNVLSGNNATANAGGIYLFSSSDNNTLSGNNVANNSQGIYLDYCSGNVLSRNAMTGNNYFGNFGVNGSVLSDFVNHVDTSNLVNGKSVYYLMNELNVVISSQTYPEGVGYVGLVNCVNVTVQGLTLTQNFQGMLLANTTDSKIIHNNVTANGFYGIHLFSSSDNVLSRNYGSFGSIDLFSSSDNNTLSDNNLEIGLESSSGNVLSSNNATLCTYGIKLDNSSGNVLSGNNLTKNFWGIELRYSSDNVVSGNFVSGENYIYTFPNGIWLYNSSGNALSDNTVTENIYGIYLESSSNNVFFHNNFINNTGLIPYGSDGSPNTWDNGYPSGGNYWSGRSGYTGVDEKSGPYQNLTGSDGIGDTPYIIDANNTDRYPLMGPFHTFSVGTWSGTAYSVDTVSNSTITNLSFNATAKTLSFNVTGTNGTMGFCRVTIPLSLMSGEWTVTVNGTQLSPPILNITIYENCTYVYFTYHHSTEMVKIMSTIAIPEFQPYMLLPLLMMITLLTATVYKRKRNIKK
jgi:parallel beta-helix repeat protein